MTQLTITNCENCGACCLEQGGPPFEMDDPVDVKRIDAAPQAAREAIVCRKASLESGFTGPDAPCCWFDMTSRNCRWHKYRPQICRNFKRGSTGCLRWRKKYIGEETHP